MRHVYETCHRAIVGRDLGKLMTLYANESVLDSSAVLVLEKDPPGIIRRRDRIRKHFASFFCDARRERRQGTGTARNNFFGTGSRWSGNTRARGPMETSSTQAAKLKIGAEILARGNSRTGVLTYLSCRRSRSRSEPRTHGHKIRTTKSRLIARLCSSIEHRRTWVHSRKLHFLA